MNRNEVRAIFYEQTEPKWQLHTKVRNDIFEGEAMTALCLTACMMARPTAACFNCVFLRTKVFICSILKTQANKLNILGIDMNSAEGYISV